MKQRTFKITLVFVGLTFLLSPTIIAAHKVFSRTYPKNTPAPQIIEVVEEEIEEVFLPSTPTATPKAKEETFTPSLRKINDNDDEKTEDDEREENEKKSLQNDD